MKKLCHDFVGIVRYRTVVKDISMMCRRKICNMYGTVRYGTLKMISDVLQLLRRKKGENEKLHYQVESAGRFVHTIRFDIDTTYQN